MNQDFRRARLHEGVVITHGHHMLGGVHDLRSIGNEKEHTNMIDFICWERVHLYHNSQEVLGSWWGQNTLSREICPALSELCLLHSKTVELTGILTWPSLPMVLCIQVNSFSLRPHHLSGYFLLQLFFPDWCSAKRSLRLPR